MTKDAFADRLEAALGDDVEVEIDRLTVELGAGEADPVELAANVAREIEAHLDAAPREETP